MKGVLNTMLNKQPMSMPCMGNINSTAAHMGCPKALGFRLSFFLGVEEIISGFGIFKGGAPLAFELGIPISNIP